ncbi:MAG: hypothetical protein J1F07_01195 [Muribaculaceae bacterium]|nr:hypothetical protein [Muribaculaceae bacterium]
MVYRFKLVSDEKDNFSREIEIDSEANFLQLRNAILDSVGYSKDELDSFFLCDDEWQKEEEITLEDMDTSSDKDTWLMETTPLYEMIEEEGQKLIFVFDYMTERSFFMEMKEAIPGRNLAEPICTLKQGTAPAQHVDIQEFERAIDDKMAKEFDLTDDFYDDGQYNEEDVQDFNLLD